MDRADATHHESEPPTVWHLCWQAAVGRDFLAHPSLAARIRRRLVDAHRSPRVLIDYVLLPTEIHVVSALPPGDSARAVARTIGNILARWVRDAQPVRGPVLAGPYHAHAIAPPDSLASEIRMLAWRPVLLGLCTTPSHYAHAALRIASGLTPARGFDARPMLRLFGSSVSPARAALRAWVAKRPSDREARLWALTRGLALATGDAEPRPFMTRPVRGTAAALVAAGGQDGIDGALKLLERWVLARLGARGGADLCRSGDATAARARALVACLAVDRGLCSAAWVARHFRRAKSTLCEQMKACRARPADRHILATPAQRLIEEALALPSAPD